MTPAGAELLAELEGPWCVGTLGWDRGAESHGSSRWFSEVSRHLRTLQPP